MKKSCVFVYFIIFGILNQSHPENAGNRISGTLDFKHFPGSAPLEVPRAFTARKSPTSFKRLAPPLRPLLKTRAR
jgi:hypothetical protein